MSCLLLLLTYPTTPRSMLNLMEFNTIQHLLSTEMTSVDSLIHASLNSSVPLANEIAEYILNNGGKRIRPMLTLLSAKAFNYQGEEHIKLAAIVELLHTATLLHDDVIDNSSMRRNAKTANAVWGNQASILVGDLLHARSFQMISALCNPIITEILAAATNVIVEGELLQMIHCHDLNTDEKTYLDIIQYKTGKLFEVSAHVGAALCQRTPEECTLMKTYGQHIGAAFQLIDDSLDYSGNPAETGKAIGNDLSEGKPSLILIHILKHGTDQQKKLIQDLFIQQTNSSIISPSYLEKIQQAIVETKAIEYVIQCAEGFVQQAFRALEILPPSPYREALYGIAQLTIKRKK
jgi:octaprenyl-diphosphate synthase